MRFYAGNALTGAHSSEKWFTECDAGRGFVRGAALGASVGNFDEFQLLNPAGSQIIIDIYLMRSSIRANDNLQLRTFDTALATLVGNGVNLKAGGAAAVGELRTAQPAALDGTLVSAIPVGSGAVINIQEFWCWQLAAGKGVMVTTAAVNEPAGAEFYWCETPL